MKIQDWGNLKNTHKHIDIVGKIIQKSSWLYILQEKLEKIIQSEKKEPVLSMTLITILYNKIITETKEQNNQINKI